MKKPSGYQFSVIGKVRSPGHSRPAVMLTHSKRWQSRAAHQSSRIRAQSGDPQGWRPACLSFLCGFRMHFGVKRTSTQGPSPIESGDTMVVP